MKAQKGDWFSLTWDIVDFYDPLSFKQYDLAPRFLYADEDTRDIVADVVNKFDRIRLTCVFLTSVFLQDDFGNKLPTHYRVGEFMPKDNSSYDKWISEYHHIHYDVCEQVRQREELQQKKLFLEHTAKVIRHDMHSGINTYIPRGLKTLLDRIPADVVKEHKLGMSITMLRKGIEHAQKVYRGVYAFTNLMRDGEVMDRHVCDLDNIIREYLADTAYSDKVFIDELIHLDVQPTLFCIAIDNLIKGGLQFNNSADKWVKIYMEDSYTIAVQDNGVGLSKEQFLQFCKPYLTNDFNAETKGLELNIAVAILEDHGFVIEPEKLDVGTIFRINIKPEREYIIGR